ncbi:hypothetical protein [Gimesia sp.]|uniref:hypothetical protein n=1 Tax=Gimesia sp. TaxID=2024833 RepID=UPI0025BE506D|nr:hypothetical protein [Gimesia sp.]
MKSSAFRVSCCITFFNLFLFCGCGNSDVRPDLQTVEGRLTINGEPAAGAMLVFYPAQGEEFDSRGSRPRAKVEENGNFQVTTYQSGDGAPAGDYQVGILWFDNPDSSTPWNKLGKRYANPRESDITVTVEEGNNQLTPIELEDVRILKRPVRRRKSQDADQVGE